MDGGAAAPRDLMDRLGGGDLASLESLSAGGGDTSSSSESEPSSSAGLDLEELGASSRLRFFSGLGDVSALSGDVSALSGDVDLEGRIVRLIVLKMIQV